MEKKQVTIESPVTVAGLTITPVTGTSIYGWRNKKGLSFFGFKKPIYVLVSDQRSPVKVFAITGGETSVEQIVSEHPELRDKIKRVAVRRPF